MKMKKLGDIDLVFGSPQMKTPAMLYRKVCMEEGDHYRDCIVEDTIAKLSWECYLRRFFF